MSIQAIRKTGFLIQDGILWGKVVGYLMYDCEDAQAREMGRTLDAIRANNYYEAIQPQLTDVQEIEVVQ
jgi:hypothetical protein